MYMYIYTYICIHRDREQESKREREGERVCIDAQLGNHPNGALISSGTLRVLRPAVCHCNKGPTQFGVLYLGP